MNQSVNGVLYVASGKKYILEAIESANSVRIYQPGLPLCIFCDDDKLITDSNLFDHIYLIEDPSFSFKDKIKCLPLTPFKRTLFLDTDIRIIGTFSELYELLDRFDLAFAHAVVRSVFDLPGIPDSFPELNTGVILYKQNKSTRNFFNAYEEKYSQLMEEEDPPRHDQPACRFALYHSDLCYYTLPPEYNLRTNKPYFVGGAREVKIIHGRGKQLNYVAKRINKSNKARVGYPDPFYRRWYLKLRRFIKSLIS